MWQESPGQGMSKQGPQLCEKWPKKKQKPPAHFHMIRRQSIKFQISPMKDVRGVVVVEKIGQTERRME